MQYPHEIQACLLFDRPVHTLEAMVKVFAQVEEGRSGARFNVPEANPGKFYRLYGGDQLMVTFEYLDTPANVEVFRGALSSRITGIVCPDIRDRLTRNRSNILINVSHGALGNSPEMLRMLQQIDFPVEGQSLAQFTRRMEVCALISRIVADHATPQAIHWVQSDQVYPPEAFDTLATLDAPSPLHIHPFLFGGTKDADGNVELGIRTFGARHFIGHEIVVEPNALPWAAHYETILAFLRVATVPNGYIIPDGDTFGPEDHSQSYRALHRPAGEDGVPVIELKPLLQAEYGFTAPDYVPRDRVFDDRMPPPELMPEDEGEKMELANEWREKRALAEGIGGRFEVRSRSELPGGSPPSPPPSAPPRPGFGGIGTRPVFGRKIV